MQRSADQHQNFLAWLLQQLKGFIWSTMVDLDDLALYPDRSTCCMYVTQEVQISISAHCKNLYVDIALRYYLASNMARNLEIS